MTSPETLLLAILLVVSVLLVLGRLRPDLVALLSLVTLGLTGLVNPAEAFSGFASQAVMTILAISIISEGLQQTGVTKQLGRLMFRLGGRKEWRLVLMTVLLGAFLSLFMNNIAAAGVLMPAAIVLSRQTRTPPSRLLIPLAFGTILGGMATLLTTSNIIVSEALRQAGYRPFGLLDFLPIGVFIVAGGALYLTLIGRRNLPRWYPAGQSARTERLHAELTSVYGLRRNLSEIEVLAGSRMAGLTLKAGDWSRRMGLNVIGISRGGRITFAPGREEIIRAGDILMVQGELPMSLLAESGLRTVRKQVRTREFVDQNATLGEVVLSPRATVAGKTLREILFREKFNLNVLAIWRQGESHQENLADIPLQFGDALLVQGTPAHIRLLRDDRDFILLEEEPEAAIHPGKARLSIIITVAALGIAALGWLPVAEVSLVGALLMVLAGCLSMDDAYRAVEWKAIFLIAGMWPLGLAMSSTGLAASFADAVLAQVAQAGPLVVAIILLLVGFLLAQLLGSQVASIVLAPIGLMMAVSIGADPRSLGMAVALGCSLAFVTPLGHPVNVLVMGSGGYRFRDYARVGGPLTILILGIIIVGLQVFWAL